MTLAGSMCQVPRKPGHAFGSWKAEKSKRSREHAVAVWELRIRQEVELVAVVAGC